MSTYLIRTQPLLILVGVTGVGKSTTVQALINNGLAFHLLPNRRVLTSRLIVAPLLQEEGKAIRELSRMERLPYVRRYRTRYPGGMAHALSQWQIEPSQRGQLFLFDGLRGENEIRYAVGFNPLAKFVFLHAPDIIRIQRLLKRRDPYDQMASPNQNQDQSATRHRFATLGVPEAAALFSAEQEQALFALVQRGEISLNDLHDKLRLMTVERRLYDANATLAALERLAPDRTLVIDTTSHSPQQVAQKIISKVRDNGQ